jgi:hypothetical protein
MKIYASKNSTNIFSIAFALCVLAGVAITVIYFRQYWYFLVALFTPLSLLTLIISQLLTSFYSIQNGYLIKQFDRRNFNYPLNHYTIDSNGKKNYKATVLSIKLIDIIKIEKRKNLFGTPFIALYYSDNQAIDIYLKTGEIDSFIKEISEK